MKKFMSTRTFRSAAGVVLCGSMFTSAQFTGPHTVHASDQETLYSLKHPAEDAGGPFTGDVGPSPLPTDTRNGDNGGGGNQQGNGNDQGTGVSSNVFVNDPCIDPPPPSRRRTVQSETSIGAFGTYMVGGYNDSYGFYDNRQGLSGYAYSVNGGQSWIDGGGLPPVSANDRYFGDPSIAVDQSQRSFGTVRQDEGQFYYASIYGTAAGVQSLSVNRGRFQTAPPQNTESRSNTRCANDPSKNGIPDANGLNEARTRIVWEPPAVAVSPTFLCGGPTPDPAGCSALDKEWLTVDQKTGELYLAYLRFGVDGATPLELVRSKDGGRTWTAPTEIVPNIDDTFNQGLHIVVTPTHRVIVSWFARTFILSPPFPEKEQRIETAFSDNDGVTFSPPTIVARVNPQAEPKGYNRGRSQILNVTYMAVGSQPGGNDSQRPTGSEDGSTPAPIYLTYFNGKTALPSSPSQAADILLSTSYDNGATWKAPVKVNTDPGNTSHVFPSVQARGNTAYVSWQDRRLDQTNNILTDTWAARSTDAGRSFHSNVRVTTVSSSWFVRADARPNFGDYNSSILVGDRYGTIWADGRFPSGTYIPPTCPAAPPPGQTCPPRLAATPDAMFSWVNFDTQGGDNGGQQSQGN